MENCPKGLKFAFSGISGRKEIHPCVQQDIGPLGPLPKKQQPTIGCSHGNSCLCPIRFTDGVISKKIYLIGAGFPENSVLMTSSDDKSGNLIVQSFPQYILAVPKGDDHIWYRSSFQFKMRNGTYYSGYWEMDVRCRFAFLACV